MATAIEAALRTRYTFDTLRALRRRFPRVRFVWLMGADNLPQLPRWQRWLDIARLLPFAVMPRPSYNQRALAGKAAHRLRHALRPPREAPALAAEPGARLDVSADAAEQALRDGAAPGGPLDPRRPLQTVRREPLLEGARP